MDFSRSSVSLTGVCLILAVLFASSASGGIPTAATQALLDANPGMRAMFDGERLIALYGVPFYTDRANSGDEAGHSGLELREVGQVDGVVVVEVEGLACTCRWGLGEACLHSGEVA